MPAKKANGKTPAPTKTKEPEGYKNHQAGSRKGDVHRLYDEKGADAAIAYALKNKLKESTARTWIGSWRRSEGKKPTLKVVPATKAKEKPNAKATA